MPATLTTEITNTEDTLDSRDIIARIEELRDERDTLKDARANVTDADPAGYNTAVKNLREWEQDYGDELDALGKLAAEAEDCAEDWEYGAQLIRDSYFEGYAQELAEDIGAIDPKASWPLTCIDWKQAARELQMDYTSVEFDGVTYWTR
jgi:hypothetical protein